MAKSTQTLSTLLDLEEEAERLVGEFTPRERGATLVTLSGELGAGKTALTKAIARVLGVEGVVTSPTFVLEKVYALSRERSAFARLIHIDAYRLERGSDLAPLGFDELMQDTHNLILLEWPERVVDMLPTPAIHISLVAHPDGSRTITYG